MADETKSAKKCFVIMPFSTPDGYDKDHFQRVYDHIIKPACEKADFTPFKADEDSRTNIIIVEVIRQIIDSDIVLCDLSSRNPNVLYELGIRQAFNKKVVLIKDNKTDKIFDIQGLRTIKYSESLRCDMVASNVDEIAKSLKSTYHDSDKDINSFVPLLSIKPAEVTAPISISDDTKLILKLLDDLSKRIANIEGQEYNIKKGIPDLPVYTDNILLSTNEKANIGDILYIGKVKIGKLLEVHENDIMFYNDDNQKYTIVQKDNVNNLSLNPVD